MYVPILPPMLENFLDAPVPYVMGLLRNRSFNILDWTVETFVRYLVSSVSQSVGQSEYQEL